MSVGAFTGAATVGSAEDDDATIAGAFCPGFYLIPLFAAFLNVVLLGPFMSRIHLLNFATASTIRKDLGSILGFRNMHILRLLGNI